MVERRKDLMLNGVSAMAIEERNGKILLLVDSGEAMRAVSPAEFMEEFKKLAFVFAVSWDKELINEYRAFYEYYREVLYR